MNARTFGTDTQQDAFFDRYGVTSYEEAGRAIADAQREHYVINNGIRHDVPQIGSTTPKVHVNGASHRAIEYLVSLARTRTPDVQPIDIRNWAVTVDRSEVSAKIDWLKAQPSVFNTDAAPADNRLERHNVPAGRYAVTSNDGQTVFVKVDRPTEGTYAGRIFVKIQAGDDLHRTPRATADALLAKIAAAGLQEAMTRYGREIGSCGHCGRTLTNEESREAGIGPVCRGKMGW